ncbi:hypothetical protein PLESTB_000213500 [Pleodorina starrii]|uniref:Apoptosis antagonizing transcription factor n=1 Tax=Pleodorina starrii TaxID=330485 RepID=A0A9W6BC98_9CHLO|nr:hypothetical protein PLESTM_001539200 [Pleodorina starrii]GLC49383.1 hypothetical protein PLESTB_000213500 [Pleodorina starrii]GLC73355.1 hypothetical protein PLESTF_001366500 [Pleodorina starrii]
MASKKKSLAQELADLFNPAPTKEYDPDALDLGEGAKLASDDEYGEARQAPTKRAPEKSMLLRGDIALEDAAYRGRKTSRAAIFGDEDGAADSDDDEDVDLDLDLGEDGDGDDDDEERGLSSEGEEEDGGAERRAAVGQAGPSGRAGVAAAGLGAKGKRGAATAANGGGPVSSEGEEDAEEEEEEEEEEGGEDEDDMEGEDGGLPSGSDSDVDLEEGGPEGADGEEEEEEEGPRGRSKRPAGRAGGGGAGGGGGGELEALEAEYEALQEEDERQLAALRKKGERDREKGAAVRNQQVLYERALEQRILLQKCLQASNGLPRPDTHAALLAAQPDVREGYAQLAAAARDTLGQLLELQHALMGRNSAITLPPPPASAAAAAAASGKRRRPDDDDDDEEEEGSDDGDADAADGGLDALWARISSHQDALAPFRDVSLDSWHRRTVLSSGSGALRNSGLRALNQSISSQVQALMRDPGKFIKRTRLVLSACPRVLCEPPRAGGAAAAELDPLGGDADPAAAAAAAAAVATSSVATDVTEEERDPETYDDSEFYQQLLKEFLDKGLSDGAAAAPKSAKKRKLVDRRASKGRKLRYHVQEKLVAFMAPVDFAPPPFAANLFSNLFGHAGK